MVATVGGYAERYVGDRAFPLLHTFLDEDDAIFKLTTVDPALMIMRREVRGEAASNATGSWIMVDREQGQAAFDFSDADVADKGFVKFQAVIIFDGQTKHFEEINILFKPVL